MREVARRSRDGRSRFTMGASSWENKCFLGNFLGFLKFKFAMANFFPKTIFKSLTRGGECDIMHP